MIREATRDDLPQGGEAQCPVCWRLFSSDACAEQHKNYAKKGRDDGFCSPPPAVGLESSQRRGLYVWGKPGIAAQDVARRDMLRAAREAKTRIVEDQ